MDNVVREAMLAKEAGMSYGQWKAMQPKQEKQPNTIPEGYASCEYCGKLFKKSHGKRFCDIGCRTDAYKPKASAYNADYYKRVGKEKRQKEKE